MNAFTYGFNELSRRSDPEWQADTEAMLVLCRHDRVWWSFYAFDVSQGASIIDPATGQPELRAAGGAARRDAPALTAAAGGGRFAPLSSVLTPRGLVL